MNSRKSLYDVASFYKKKAVLKSSYQGMRYQIEQAEQEETKLLRVTIWPEPFCFEKTEEDKKSKKEFSFDEQGLDRAYDWLCEQYELQKDRWIQASQADWA